MPEGDTVYLTARRLHAALAGRRLTRAELRHPALVGADLTGRVVREVRSVGKHLFIRFTDGYSLHNHLRMDGTWHLYRPTDRWRRAGHHARVVLGTDSRVAVGFRLHDLALVRTVAEGELVGHLGPDLLDPDWSERQAEEAVRRLRAHPDAEIGLVLLDQRVVAGVGNLYRCEICFLLRCSPWTPIRDVPDAEKVIALARNLLRRNAHRPEQSTTGELARGRQHWVYQRAGQPCRRCGQPIRGAVQGAGLQERPVYYCPHCQPGPHPAAVSQARRG